jgi:uncharacterized protein YaaR (DUF327 family)
MITLKNTQLIILDSFMRDRMSKSRSASTLKTYKDELRLFIRFIPDIQLNKLHLIYHEHILSRIMSYPVVQTIRYKMKGVVYHVKFLERFNN